MRHNAIDTNRSLPLETRCASASFALASPYVPYAILRGAHRRITEAMVAARSRLPVTLCYVDRERGFVALGICIDIGNEADATRRLRRELDELAHGAPLRVFRCAPAVRHANKRDYNRPLTGGLYVSRLNACGKGTLCIAATRGDMPGFVTSGHVAARDHDDLYQPRVGMLNDWRAGRVTAVSDYAHAAHSDSAFVASSAEIAPRSIWRSSISAYTVDAICAAPQRGVAVSMQGASTQTRLRSGVIRATGVTVMFDDNGVLTDQLLANYASSEGDSGAPVFHVAADPSVYLVGLNVGAIRPACAESAEPAHDPSLGPSAPNGTYAVISPWTNVERDLDVTLGLGTVSL